MAPLTCVLKFSLKYILNLQKSFKYKKSISVEVRLMATGDAPIMKQKNYKVDQEKKVEWIIAFIRKYLKLEDPESLVNYKPVSITTFYQCYWASVISFASSTEFSVTRKKFGYSTTFFLILQYIHWPKLAHNFAFKMQDFSHFD